MTTSDPAGGISTVHGTFTVERTYAHPPAAVFRVFEDPALKLRWSVEAGAGTVEHHELDFSVGGSESTVFQFGDGPVVRSDTIYQDIVRDSRIIYTFRMQKDDRPAAVALTTVELTETDGGTRLVLTEQGAFLDGLHAADIAEHGSGVLLRRIGKVLDEASAPG